MPDRRMATDPIHPLPVTMVGMNAQRRHRLLLMAVTAIAAVTVPTIAAPRALPWLHHFDATADLLAGEALVFVVGRSCLPLWPARWPWWRSLSRYSGRSYMCGSASASSIPPHTPRAKSGRSKGAFTRRARWKADRCSWVVLARGVGLAVRHSQLDSLQLGGDDSPERGRHGDHQRDVGTTRPDGAPEGVGLSGARACSSCRPMGRLNGSAQSGSGRSTGRACPGARSTRRGMGSPCSSSAARTPRATASRSG
jgi:hypothetical protein